MLMLDQNTLLALAPPALVALLGILVIVADIARPERHRMVTVIAVGGLASLIGLTAVIGPLPGIGLLPGATEVFDGVYVRDGLTALLDLLLMSIALLTILFGPDYLYPRRLPTAEYAALLLFAISGATVSYTHLTLPTICSV